MLREVFRRLRQANIQINPEKCQFCRKSLTYLGHVFTAEGIETDVDKVEVILKLPRQTAIRDVCRFLGVASWYSRFVPNFSIISTPLTRLLKKNHRWKWIEDQDTAFGELIEKLTASSVLACPDFNRRFALQTDVSDLGLGIALTQRTDEGKRKIAYASRMLSAPDGLYQEFVQPASPVVRNIQQFDFDL